MMTRIVIVGAFIASAVFLAGCVSSNYMRVGDATYPPRPPNSIIDVYVPLETPVAIQQEIPNAKTMSQLPAFATVIGRIDSNGAPAAEWSAVVEDAKNKAREIGGDAIVITRWGSPMTSVDAYGNTYYGKAISLNVMHY